MKKIKELSLKPILAMVLTSVMVIVSGCTAAVAPATSTRNLTPSPLTAQSDQFNIVTKDGVAIACPKHWQTYSNDPGLVYGVSRAETIRIVIGVLPAADQGYYDSLVAQGTVHSIIVAGYPAYRSDYVYSWNGHQLTNWCITAVNGDKACHFMILCDTSMIVTYAPIFEYVLNSLKFL